MAKIYDGNHKWWFVHPSVWRAMRARHEGGNIRFYGRMGDVICVGVLNRYLNTISIPYFIDFKAISFKETINNLESQSKGGVLTPDKIPVGERTYFI